MNTVKQIANYATAGYPAVYIQTHEDQRIEGDIARATKQVRGEPYTVATWTCTSGLVHHVSDKPDIYGDTEDINAALDTYYNQENQKKFGRSILIVYGLHMLFADPGLGLIQKLKDCLLIGKSSNRMMVIIAPTVKIPLELEKLITVIEYKLPTRDELLEVAKAVCDSVSYKIDKSTVDAVMDAASGLTTHEAENAFALSLIEAGKLDADVIAREKASTIKKNGLLEIVDCDIGLDEVGGSEEAKSWLTKRRNAFTKEARKYGLPMLKGFLQVGIPGCGKTLLAKATAKILGLPLLKLDGGKIFGSLVGQSESNIRSVIATAEAIAPCVLLIDEIEKGFSGSKSSGSTDGGTAARVLGSFLQWMNDKSSPVFVVATANDVSQLPPEFLRKGRFDEMFFVDLPDEDERKQIWKIQIRRNNRKPESFDVDELAKVTERWTGAEIEALFKEALFAAYDEGKEPTTKLLVNLSSQVVPLSKMMSNQIDGMRDWAKGRTRSASTHKTADVQTIGRRL